MATSAEEKANPLKRGKMRLKHKLLLYVFCFLMMGLLRTGFVFFMIGMLPCIVAYYMDVSKHQYTFNTIFAANMSGMMPFVTRIIKEGPSSGLLQELMGSSFTWIVIYGSAMMGLLLIKICPLLAQAMVKGVHQTQIKRYEWVQKKLEGEWGPEVAQFSGDNKYKQLQ